METKAPYGWSSLSKDEVSYEFGEAKMNIPSNQIGEGEDDYHSRYVPPDSEFGAAKVADNRDGYGNKDDYHPKAGDKDPADVGTIDLPIGHIVLEDGVVQGRNYYLVQDIKSEKMYTVVPNFKAGETYKSPMRGDRTSALQDAYRTLSGTLPDSALAQLQERFPETLAL